MPKLTAHGQTTYSNHACCADTKHPTTWPDTCMLACWLQQLSAMGRQLPQHCHIGACLQAAMAVAAS